MAHKAVGSIPIAHPNFILYPSTGARSSARIERQTSDLKVAGSNPAGRASILGRGQAVRLGTLDPAS